MKNIISIWLYQTLLILVLKHIKMCHSNDPSESYDLNRSYYEERNINNKRGYGEPDNISRANQIYEAAYADRARQLRQQTYIGRVGDSKFTKPENLRQSLNPDSEYNLRSELANHGYGITRNGDSSENIDIGSAGTNSIEGDASNVSDTHELSHANITTFTSRIVKPIAGSCSCQGTGASDEVNFLCFSSKDGSKNFSIKSKGITKFNLEDIIKAYKFYYDNIIFKNVNFENINGESNFQHDSDSKFNFEMSKYKIDGFHEGYFNFDSESKFDINEIKNGGNTIKVNTFDKYDINTLKKDSNKFNFDITKNDVQDIDIHKYFNNNNNFNTQFDKNINGNFNFETNAKIEAFKKHQSMTESKKNSQFHFDNDFNVNQYNFNSDVQDDAQVEFEANAKAHAQAKAIAKAEAILEAHAKAQSEAKAQSVIERQIFAQAQAEAQAQAMIQADSHYNIQNQGQTQAHAQAQAQAHAQAQAQAHAQAQAQAHAQAQAQVHAHAQAQAQANVQAYNQGQINSQGQAFTYSDLNNNVRPKKVFNFGVGVETPIIGGGFNLGLTGGLGKKIGGSISKTLGGTWTGNGGANVAVGVRAPLVRPAAVGDDGMGTSAVVGGAYTGDEFNYPDGFYDDNPNDGYTSVSYPGVVAYAAPIDSPITSNRLYGDGHNQKDLFTPYGGSGYPRYP